MSSGGFRGGLVEGSRVLLVRAAGPPVGKANGSASRSHDHAGVIDAVSADLVRRCGLPADRLDAVAAPAAPVDVAVALARVAAEAADTFLVYWFGPVLSPASPAAPVMSGSDGTPRLAVGPTVPGAGGGGGGGTLSFADLLALVAGSPAPRRGIVLDAWLEDLGSPGNPEYPGGSGDSGDSGDQSDQGDPEDPADSAGPSTAVVAARLAEVARVRGSGVEVLVSVAPDEAAFRAESAGPATSRLSELLSQGDPDAPAEFSVGRLHDLIVHALAARAAVSALRVPADWAEDFTLANNPARVGALHRREPVPTTVLPDSARSVPVPDSGALVATAGGEPECPYPGLSSFGAESERFFFGRAELVSETLSRLRERAGTTGPLVLVGASGSGKSSLLRAGVLPAVARGALGDAVPAGSPRVVLTPTEHPLAVLVTRVAEAVAAPALGWVLRDALRADPERFSEILADLLTPSVAGGQSQDGEEGQAAGGRGLVIAVDQFEETFTLCADEGEREAFVRALCAAALPTPSGRPAPAVVILAVRGDFYLRCAAYPPLVSALQSGQIVVGPMDRAEVREAVVEPARAVGVEVEPALVDLLLDDLGAGGEDRDGDDGVGAGRGQADPGSLPLLAHALRVTWDERAGRTLTVAGYRRSGRLAGALAKSADDLFTGFDNAGQQAARSLLLRLVRVGGGGEVTRRPMRRDALVAEVPDPGAETILDALVSSRLLEADEDRVQIAHEALLRSWPRLRDWIELDRAGVLIRQQLDDGGRDWERHGRDPSFLIGGLRLAAAREWVEVGVRRRSLGSPAGEFYDASFARERAGAVATRRRTRRLRAMVAGLTVLVLIATGLTVLAFEQRSTANAARDRALSQRIAGVADDQAEGRPEVGTHLALAARTFADTAEARSSIMQANTPIRRQAAHEQPIGAVAYSPDGRLAASGSDDSTAALWDGAQPEERGLLGRLPSHRTGDKPYAVKAVAFDRGSRVLATGTSNGLTRLWDVSNPAKPVLRATLPQADDGPQGGVYGLAFSPTADILAVGGYGSTVRLFDVSDPAHPAPLDILGDPGDRDRHAKVVRSVEFSPDGTKLLTGGADGRAILWDVRQPAGPSVPMTELVDPELEVTQNAVAVGFGPDGRFLARSHGNFVQLFELDGASGAVALVDSVVVGEPVYDLVVLDEGAVAVVSNINILRLFHPRWTAEVVANSVLTRRGWAVAASPDGRHLVTGIDDQDLRFFRWKGTMLTDGLEMTAVESSSSGGRVYLGTVGGDIMAYDTDPGGEGAITLAGWIDNALAFHDEPAWANRGLAGEGVFAMALLPGEQVLLTASLEGFKFWDVSPGAMERWDHRPSQGIEVFQSGYSAPRVLPEPLSATRIGNVSAKTDPSARQYNSIHLSADGTRLAIGDNRGGFEVWDVSDPRRPSMVERRAKAHTDASRVIVAFSSDGQMIATTGNDGWVKIWNTGGVASDPLDTARYGGHPRDLEFSPTGPLLAVAGTDRVTHLVDVSTPTDIVEVASTPPSRNSINSVAFSPDGTRLVTGGIDVKMWGLDADHRTPVLIADLPAAAEVAAVAFNPDGKYVLPGYRLTNTGWLPADVDAYAEKLCRSFGDAVTAEEWREYLPDVDYRAPCAG